MGSATSKAIADNAEDKLCAGSFSCCSTPAQPPSPTAFLRLCCALYPPANDADAAAAAALLCLNKLKQLRFVEQPTGNPDLKPK